MRKLVDKIFSMRMMALAMIIFLVAIGMATMIESTYDIQTAKIMVYNAAWFEVLLAYLCLNLVANCFRYNLFRRSKIAVLTFHISFIIIIIGAGITRHFSFEGLMLIREGTASSVLYASEPHVFYSISNGADQLVTETHKKYLSEQTNNHFKYTSKIPGRKEPITIEYVDFKRKQVDSLIINDSIKSDVIDIVLGGMKSNYIGPDDFVMVGDIPLSYNKKDALPGISVTNNKGKLMVETKVPMRYLPMSEMTKYRQAGITPPDSLYVEVPTDSMVPFLPTTLYQVNDQQFVFKSNIPNAKMMKMPSGRKDMGVDVLVVKITDGKATKIVELEGGMGQIPSQHKFIFNGLAYQMAYGSTMFKLPFEIICRDFILDTYPGSDIASSYASEVTINDPANNYKRDQRIFMNNVMDYNGFRFFQSAYDLDDPSTPENEEGTRLSVNHDWWGTNVTYLGYLLLSIGMLLSIFAPEGRIKELMTKIRKSSTKRNAVVKTVFVTLLLSISASPLSAQEGHSHEHAHDGHTHFDGDGHDHDHDHSHELTEEDLRKRDEFEKNHARPEKPVYRIISKEHSEQLAELLVQDYRGRIIPMHTMCNQLLIKFYGKKEYKGYNSIQTVMSMHMYPEYWISQPVISVPMAVRERLNLKDYVSFMDLMDPVTGELKYLKEYNEAHRKLESQRSEYEKKLLKLIERHEVIQSFFTWQYMKLLPLRGDPNHMWYIPFSEEIMKNDEASSILAIKYIASLDEAATNNSYGKSLDLLNEFKKYQRAASPADILPSDRHVKVEISYNKMHIFKNAMYLYLVLGFILLIISFIRIFNEPTERSEKIFKRLSTPFVVLMILAFAYHGGGLLMRSYVSGHAPWSDGYEAVVFIAWVTMVAGLIFAKKNPVILAGTAILAFFMIFVTELDLLDPDITPLQPVLKSYWLKIHVAIITGSYGFIGLGAILGLLNLVMYNFRTKKNGKRITANINEITYVSEVTMTIGLFMLTIGTFLGGIWANESWGRYWGWDPKETWALVSVLVYAVLLHLRFIPGMSNKLTFNIGSLWSFTAIIFTFFGVNFYLVGLHSYANGDGLGEVPMWIFWTCFGFYAFTELSAVNYTLYKYEKGDLNLKHFLKKAVITTGVLYIACILAMWLIERKWDTNTFVVFTKIVGLCLAVIALMYAYAQMQLKNKQIEA